MGRWRWLDGSWPRLCLEGSSSCSSPGPRGRCARGLPGQLARGWCRTVGWGERRGLGQGDPGVEEPGVHLDRWSRGSRCTPGYRRNQVADPGVGGSWRAAIGSQCSKSRRSRIISSMKFCISIMKYLYAHYTILYAPAIWYDVVCFKEHWPNCKCNCKCP